MKYNKTKRIFALLLLFCAFAQGAWAQANWEAVYATTQTTSDSWTALTEGSTTGQTHVHQQHGWR